MELQGNLFSGGGGPQSDPLKSTTDKTDTVFKVQEGKKPELAKTRMDGLRDGCQKYVFSQPFTKESLGKELEFKHKAFNVFFTAAMVPALPFSIGMCAARLSYVAYKEPKVMQKNLQTVAILEQRCAKYGATISPELKEKMVNLKNYNSPEKPEGYTGPHRSDHLSDKPLARMIKEVHKGLEKAMAERQNQMDQELGNLSETCENMGLIETTEDGTKVAVGELKERLTEESQGILSKREITMAEEHQLLEEMKSILAEIRPETPSKPGIEIEGTLSKSRTEEVDVESKEAESTEESKKSTEDVAVSAKSTEKVEVASTKLESTSEKDFSKVKSTENAMKDFIKHGVVIDVKDGVKVAKEVSVSTIVQGLIVMYPKSKGDQEFADLHAAMVDAKKEINESEKRNEMGRVLDLTIGIFESNLYNPSIQADLKNVDSSIRQILHEVKSDSKAISDPVIQQKAKQLEKLIFNAEPMEIKETITKEKAEIEEKAEKDKAKMEKRLDNIRKGSYGSKGKIDDLAGNLSKDLKDINLSFYQNLDAHDHLKFDRNGTETWGKGMNDLVEYTNTTLRNFIVSDILNTGKGKEVGRSVEFWTKVALKSVENGDFGTAHAIQITLKDKSISRLDDQLGISKSGKEDIEKLDNIFNPVGGFKNARNAQDSFKGVIIPSMLIIAKDKEMTLDFNENFNKTAEGELIPNHAKIEMVGGLLNKLGQVSKEKISPESKFEGSSSILKFQVTDKNNVPKRGKNAENALMRRSLEIKPSSFVKVDDDVPDEIEIKKEI